MGVTHADPIPQFSDNPGFRTAGQYALDHVGVSCQQIAETILSVAAASIDFSNIPQTYRDLLLLFDGRGDTVNSMERWLRFNSDSTLGNYDWVDLRTTGTTVAATETIGTSYIYSGLIPASSEPAGEAGFAGIQVFDYARTTWNKTLNSHWGMSKQTAGQTSVGVTAGFWRSTAAITGISLLATGGGNFVAGTRATLWGVV
jgi:hypothetical protein